MACIATRTDHCRWTVIQQTHVEKNSVTHVHFAADNHRMMRPHNPCPSSPIAEPARSCHFPIVWGAGPGWPRALPGLEKRFLSARSTPKMPISLQVSRLLERSQACQRHGPRKAREERNFRSLVALAADAVLVGSSARKMWPWSLGGAWSTLRRMHQDPRAATKPRCHCFKHTLWNAESRPAWQASASEASGTCAAIGKCWRLGLQNVAVQFGDVWSALLGQLPTVVRECGTSRVQMWGCQVTPQEGRVRRDSNVSLRVV